MKTTSEPAAGPSVSRREFIRRSAIAGCCLAAQTQLLAATDRSVASARPNGFASIAVISAPVSTDINPRAASWGFLTEILRQAGLSFEPLKPSALQRLFERPKAIAILAGDLPLNARDRDALTDWVKRGGLLLGIGGTSGLDDIFGVKGATPLAEGWLKVTATDHPVTKGLRSSLHVFGGCTLKPGSANSLADLELANRSIRGSALLENQCGKGRAILLGPDLIFSIVHIQQGNPVLQDGRPAADGSAPLNDGLLKAEDGLALDWERDRVVAEPDGGRVFLEPITDELREIILRSIFHLAIQDGLTLPMLWYWPRSLRSVGLLSNDTDGNDPQKAPAMLEVLNRCGIKSTWCILYPGYPGDFYHKLNDQGFEIGLHFDAMTGGPRTSWSRENFVFQHDWLLKAAGLRQIYSNKNHYTRWEGRLDFLRWCEELGLHSDQTRGPSKKGTIGFPLGGSQPYFPIDDETRQPRALRVLEVNLLTQDLVITCPAPYGRQLVDSALRHYGVAHLLFHPAHILKPGVAEALSGVVDYGRAQGLEWWTNEQIHQWVIRRREVHASCGSAAITLRTAAPLEGITLLLLKPGSAPRSVSIDGAPARAASWQAHGFNFDAVTLNLRRKATVTVGG